jgi:hypothetical protein
VIGRATRRTSLPDAYQGVASGEGTAPRLPLCLRDPGVSGVRFPFPPHARRDRATPPGGSVLGEVRSR